MSVSITYAGINMPGFYVGLSFAVGFVVVLARRYHLCNNYMEAKHGEKTKATDTPCALTLPLQQGISTPEPFQHGDRH